MRQLWNHGSGFRSQGSVPTSGPESGIGTQGGSTADLENELAGLPLRYLIGASACGSGRDGEIIEVPYDAAGKPAKGIAIKYCNLFDEKNTGAYGPYLHSSDIASQYHEGQIDPKGAGWVKNLAEQFARAIAQDFHYVELDNADAYALADVLNALDLAKHYGLKVIAKNPLLLGDGVAYIAHSAVVGAIAERGAGPPNEMDALRKRAGKPTLPVWFVAFGDGRAWAANTANSVNEMGLVNVGVTYSAAGEYGDSIDFLRPIAAAPSAPSRPSAADVGAGFKPAPTPHGANTSNFGRCVKLVLVHEGGNDDDPRDPGGRTSRGITQSEWTAWRKTHRGLPVDVWQAPQDQVEAIYKQQYWNAMKCDALPTGVDYCVFDFGVNSGIERSATMLQRSTNVSVDGLVGSATIAATKEFDARALIDHICDQRLDYLRALSTWATFGRGWSNRVADVRRDAIAMVVGASVQAPKLVLHPDAPELHDLGHRVRRTMLAKNYPWFADQNVVSIEGLNPDGKPNANRHNAFDDVKMVLDGSGRIIGGPWEATTHPGFYWTQHPMAEGGAFIIALGPQACWTPGPYHNLEVWRQAEDSVIWGHRDPNCTYKRQGAPIKHGDIGVHHHHGYNLPKDNIANAAAGCQVIRLNDGQEEFMRITKKCPRYLADPKGYRLTATVLEAKDLLP
jgi:lysozyme family protein